MGNGRRRTDGAEGRGGVEAIFVMLGAERQAKPRHGFQPDNIGGDKCIRRRAFLDRNSQ